MNKKVAFWVGRFQFFKIDKELIKTFNNIVDKYDYVYFVVCLSPVRYTKLHPFDFQTRKSVLLDFFKNKKDKVKILYLNDCPEDITWSQELDRLIDKNLFFTDDVFVIGREQTIGLRYKGSFKFEPVDNSFIISYEKLVKNSLISPPINDEAFRLGILSTIYGQFPTVFTCVDVAILNDKNEILLAFKNKDIVNGNIPLRFIGGFADVKSNSFEIDAKREVQEEAGIEIDNLQYIGSSLVNDYRYRDEENKVKTILFKAKYIFGAPRPSDDIDGLQWVPLKDFNPNILVDAHKEIWNKFGDKIFN